MAIFSQEAFPKSTFTFEARQTLRRNLMKMDVKKRFPQTLQAISWTVDDRIAYRRFDQNGKGIPYLGIANLDGTHAEDKIDSVYGGIAASPTNPSEVAAIRSNDICLWAPDIDTVSSLKSHPLASTADTDSSQLAWSPNGQLLAVIGDSIVQAVDDMMYRRLTIFNRSMEVVRAIQSVNFYAHLAWFPDSGGVVFNVDDEKHSTFFVRIGDADFYEIAGKTRYTFSPVDFRFTCTSHSHPGRLQLEYRDVSEDEPYLLAEHAGQGYVRNYNWLKWSPDGRFIVFDWNDPVGQQVYVFDSHKREMKTYVHPSSQPQLYSPTWSPDSKRVAFVSGADVVYLTV
jgi:WD40 repeat protein